MKTNHNTLLYMILVLMLFLFVAKNPVSVFADSTPAEELEGAESKMSIMLKFSEETAYPENKANFLAKKYNGTVKYVYRNTIKGANLTIPHKSLASVLKHESVTLLSQEKRMRAIGRSTRNDEETSDSESKNDNQRVPIGIQRVRADEVSDDHDHKDVNVAVLDTGIDRDHPDLKANIKGGINFHPEKDQDEWGDQHYHGTHVAGTIAARDNKIGVVGVAPRANLYSVRVLNSEGRGGGGSVIKGIDWAAKNANDIDVANLSLGGPAISRLFGMDVMGEALQKAVSGGLAVSVAAGNMGIPAKFFTPAGYEQGTTVTAINPRNDQFADFSNYGMHTTVVAAPGVQVFSTAPQEKGSYRSLNGTSMAAPHVAGGMALLLGNNPDLSPEKIDEIIRNKGISVNWGNRPFLARNNPEPLMNARKLADYDRDENQVASSSENNKSLFQKLLQGF